MKKHIISADADQVAGEWDGDQARHVAGEYASSGTVGSVLAQFATTGRAEAVAFLDDIAATRAQIRNSAVKPHPGWSLELDMLATYAINNPGEPK